MHIAKAADCRAVETCFGRDVFKAPATTPLPTRRPPQRRRPICQSYLAHLLHLLSPGLVAALHTAHRGLLLVDIDGGAVAAGAIRSFLILRTCKV